MITKHDLRQHCWLKKNIKRLEDRLLELQTKATSMTVTLKQDPVCGGGDRDRMAFNVSKIIEVRDQINEQLVKAYALEAKIEKAIETLPEREKMLIRLKYVDCKTFEEVCVEMHYEWAQIHRIHAKSLRMLSNELS